MDMYARVCTYRTEPGTTGAPTEETVKRVLDLPGCRGLQYLKGQGDRSLSITLWETEEAMAASHQPADQIRAETTREQHMQVLDVEEYEILTNRLND